MPGANTDQCYYIDDITVNGEKVDVSYATEYNNDFDDGQEVTESIPIDVTDGLIVI